jgi:putative peptidoglycan lipid II flippase
LVEPGAVLADRYVVEDLLAQEGPSESWRARDRMLARSVVLVVLPSDSPYAANLLAAAKRASRVTDTRILQVLDAVDDGELTYVVREWATGQSLDIVLSEGPLAARRATWLIREVAAAVGNAHRLNLPHRRLAPDNVVVTKSSGVKLIGLGTAAALRGEPGPDEDPELEDTLDLGRLLYACLTARWPGGDNLGHRLPAAPTEHGRLLRPRQVRAGVPRPLDAVCDRILGQQSRYGTPITTVDEVTEALSEILAEEGTNTGVNLGVSSTPSSPHRLEPPPALLLREGEDPPTGEQPIYNTMHGETTSSLRRTLGWTALGLLIAAAVLLAYLVGQYATNESPDDGATTQTQTSTQAPRAVPLPITSATDFDPQGEGEPGENSDEVPLATDDSKTTAWTTLEYRTNPQLGLLKDGVGLIVDLGQVRTVSSVHLAMIGEGTDVELRVAPQDATSAPTDSAESYQRVATQANAGTTVELTPDEPVQAQFLLIWLTSLPEVSQDHYRGAIADIEVLGE